MGFFDDFASAVTNYPSASVNLQIVSVEVVSGTAGSVNVNEVWRFQVRITNNGHLNMKNVTLHLQGQSGAQVSSSSTSGFTTGIITTAAVASVPAHGSGTTGYYYFKAPPTSTATPVSLVTAHVNAWDGDLNYLLLNLSGHADPPKATYSAQVYP